MWHHTKTNRSNTEITAGAQLVSQENIPHEVVFISHTKKTMIVMDKARTVCYTLCTDSDHTFHVSAVWNTDKDTFKRGFMRGFMGIGMKNGVFVLASSTVVEEPIEVGDILHTSDPVMFGANHVVMYISPTDDAMVTSTDGVSRVWNKMNSERLLNVVYKG